MITEIDRDRLGSVFREALIDYLASPAGRDRVRAVVSEMEEEA